MKKKCSQVWEHFDVIDDGRCVCKHCDQVVTAMKGSSSNLLRHYRTKHGSFTPRNRTDDAISSIEITQPADAGEGETEDKPKIVQRRQSRSVTTLTATRGFSSSRVTVEEPKHFTKAIIRKPAPFFSGIAVSKGDFVPLDLNDFAGKYVVLLFYPLDFDVDPDEILAYSDRLSEFTALNAAVVLCSVDSHFTHQAWSRQSRLEGGLGPIKVPLLSDLKRTISQDYGVYLPDVGHSARGLFIIDENGILRYSSINDINLCHTVNETIRILLALGEHEEPQPSSVHRSYVPPPKRTTKRTNIRAYEVEAFPGVEMYVPHIET